MNFKPFSKSSGRALLALLVLFCDWVLAQAPPTLPNRPMRTLSPTNATAPATPPATAAPAATPAASSAFPAFPALPTPSRALPRTNVAPATPGSIPVLPTVTPGAQVIPATPATTIPPGGINLPGTTGTIGTGLASGGTNKLNVGDGEMIPANALQFKNMDLDSVLKIYVELVRRNVLRPTSLPAATITFVNTTPLTKDEAIRAIEAVLAMNQIAIINVGEKFVKVVPQAQAFPEAKESTDSADVLKLPELGPYLTVVRQLTNAKPSEVMAAIAPFAKLQGGVVPIDSCGVLVMRDYADNLKHMISMIDKIDVAYPVEIEPVVIPIKYALAGDIAQVLGSLTSGGGVTSAGGSSGSSGGSTMRRGLSGGSSSGGFGNSMNRGGMGGGYPGSPGYGSQGFGTPGTMNQPSNPGAAQSSFADRLKNIVSKATGSGDFQILGTTKIIADERSNALLVFANKQDMAMITNIISKLDVVQAQVLIEALIVEVTLGNSRDIGISYLQRSKGTANTSGLGLVNEFVNPTSIAGKIAGSLGTNDTTTTSGGFSYFVQSKDLDVAFQALAKDSRSRVLSRPRVQTSHAVQADLFSGETRPYPTGSSYGGAYGGYSSIQQLQIGIRLSVLPLINPDGLVVMEIQQSIQSVGGSVKIDNVGDVPITKDSTANAKVAIRDKQTVILGGFIQANSDTSQSGVPFLKDIPGLGLLFRSKGNKANRTELIVFIRPTVLPTPESASEMAEKERKASTGAAEAEMDFKDDEQKMLEDREKRMKAKEELKRKEDARKAKMKKK